MVKIQTALVGSVNWGRTNVSATAPHDLYSAFDIVDHLIFLDIHQKHFGATGPALWFQLYLSDGTQTIHVSCYQS